MSPRLFSPRIRGNSSGTLIKWDDVPPLSENFDRSPRHHSSSRYGTC